MGRCVTEQTKPIGLVRGDESYGVEGNGDLRYILERKKKKEKREERKIGLTNRMAFKTESWSINPAKNVFPSLTLEQSAVKFVEILLQPIYLHLFILQNYLEAYKFVIIAHIP